MATVQDIALDLDGIGKMYGRRRVLERISFSVRSGDVVIIAGPNGSGKSTLLRIVAGLLRPSRGDVRLALDGRTLDAAQRRRAVGYAAPDLALYAELTGAENLGFFSAVRGLRLRREDIQARLEQVGLGGRGGDLVGAYSSGMRQRLRLAFALLADPRVMLLDEPSATLDEDGYRIVTRMVAGHRSAGGVALLATNDPRERSLGERTLVLGR